ncbi:MAG: hypothetical protein M1839_001670 [Geoglossum umbratile]|nr:MAG: hypothetical protein M1839_001670 [Geoglossum umbratile]
MFTRCTGKGIDKDTAEDVRSYVSGPLSQMLGIKNQIRPQGYTDEVDLENMEVVITPSNNVPTICLKVNQDNMKGKKDTPQFVDVILREWKVMAQCPVIAFLALAFADNAFRDISTPEELFSLRIPKGEDHLPIPWKQDMQDIPIFQQQTKGGVSPGRRESTSPSKHRIRLPRRSEARKPFRHRAGSRRHFREGSGGPGREPGFERRE